MSELDLYGAYAIYYIKCKNCGHEIEVKEFIDGRKETLWYCPKCGARVND